MTGSYPSARVAFFRALGLGIANYVLGRVGDKKFLEPTKVAISYSRIIALLQATIHLIPMFGATTIIYLNVSGLYPGPSFKSVSSVQFAAKIHEMTMIASLSHIVLSSVRRELMFGPGTPYGALFPGLQLSQVSYLWSMEFWGLVTSATYPLQRKIKLLVIIVGCIILASSVGPSSAIGMIPQRHQRPAGSTNAWLNGTHADFWPDVVRAFSVPVSCNTTSAIQDRTDCPSSGWQGITDFAPFYGVQLGPKDSNWKSIITRGSMHYKPPSVQLPSRVSFRTLSVHDDYMIVHSSATVQTGPMADALSSVAELWRNSVLSSAFGRSGNRVLFSLQSAVHTTKALQPVVGTACVAGNTIEGANDTRPLTFESELGSDFRYPTRPNFQNITRAQLWTLQGDSSEPRLIFVDPPKDDPRLLNISLAAILLNVRHPAGLTQNYSGCVISAGWMMADMNTTGGYDEKIVKSSPTPCEQRNSYNKFPRCPLRYITITKEWAKFLNPTINQTNSTVFGSLATRVPISSLDKKDYSSLDSNEELLAALVANGLSNIGNGRILQGNVSIEPYQYAPEQDELDGTEWIMQGREFFTVDSNKSKNWVKIRIDSSVESLGYSTHGLPIKIALTVLGIYCVCATLHVVQSCVSGISSTSWDSIAEVTALAINSPPTERLRNTCAGIASLNCFKQRVKIVGNPEAKGFDEAGDDHLQLVFCDDGNKLMPGPSAELNKAYGSMARLGSERDKPQTFDRINRRRPRRMSV